MVHGLADGNSRWWAAAVILIPAAYGASWGRRYGWRSYIGVRQNGIAVGNGGREIVIPWDDVTSVRAGYSGIAINRTNGTTVTATAVQKTNLARWLGRTHTRADTVVATLKSHARSHGVELP